MVLESTNDRLDTIHDEGYQCWDDNREHGKKLCPYNDGSKEYIAWMQGYEDAQKDEEDHSPAYEE